MKRVLEICVDSVESAFAAQKGGADRIELCASLNEGGITPSYGTIKFITDKLKIPVNVLVRPCPGNFYYSDEEFEIIKCDIELIKKLNANGIVVGILNDDNTIDVERMRELIDCAQPMEVTFNRAFDLVPDPIEALNVLIELAVDRILTSGQKSCAEEGIDLIEDLVEQAKDELIIMPGGGITPDNIKTILTKTGAKEIHSSASDNIIDLTGEEFFGSVTRKITSADKVRSMKMIIESMIK